jgi:hypothetical protein
MVVKMAFTPLTFSSTATAAAANTELKARPTGLRA